jgi:lipoyl(octanoyl) transferase
VDFEVQDLGRLDYRTAWDYQLDAVSEVQQGARNRLLLVEHEPVLTLGANFHQENLLLPRSEYERRGLQVIETDRGGDVTWHGPGQLVIYPIFDLRESKDLHRWLRTLEEAMLMTVSSFGLKGRRFPPHTGAWIGDRKIAAIGIKVKRWVSLHGISLNCNNDLTTYDLFTPCGIREYGVTSLTKELRREVDLTEAKAPVIEAFQRVGAGLNIDLE